MVSNMRYQKYTNKFGGFYRIPLTILLVSLIRLSPSDISFWICN